LKRKKFLNCIKTNGNRSYLLRNFKPEARERGRNNLEMLERTDMSG